MKHLIDSSSGVLGLFYGFLFACLFAGFFGFCLLGFVLFCFCFGVFFTISIILFEKNKFKL